MNTLKVLRSRPTLFFRLCGIRLDDFDDLVKKLTLCDLKASTNVCLARTASVALVPGASMSLIYYPTYTPHVFLGLVFGVSSPTVCRVNRAMTHLMADHFRMPEREVRLSEEEKDELLYLMVDGTERPIHRSGKPGERKKNYSGEKKRHTAVHQIITDNNKRILAVGIPDFASEWNRRSVE